MLIRIKKEDSCIEVPRYESKGSSGFDLRAYMGSTVILEPRDIKVIPTGLHFEIPTGFEMQIRPRSGLAVNEGVTVLNTPGTVDSDYRGEVKVILINFGQSKIKIVSGDRIAQGVIAPIKQVEFYEIGSDEDLTETIREASGFGSTGIN